jgi:hypothetical protein
MLFLSDSWNDATSTKKASLASSTVPPPLLLNGLCNEGTTGVYASAV